MAKKNLVLIKLVAAEAPGFFYVRSKNPKKTTEKLKFRKYHPVLRKHVLFEEKKLSS
jgi:large subunit ribosomal protein L33